MKTPKEIMETMTTEDIEKKIEAMDEYLYKADEELWELKRERNIYGLALFMLDEGLFTKTLQ